ncbi:radical SAM protein [Octadecabacter sp.]|nr:radical SAM protein [Octadecabacter sp.]
MKVALVRVLGKDALDYNTADYNVGFLFLRWAAEQEGAQVDIFDGITPEHHDNIMSKSGAYDIVGYNVHYLNIVESIQTLKNLKATNPHTTTVFGGDHPSGCSAELFSDIAELDAVCVGEGEEVLRRLIRMVRNDAASAKRIGPMFPESFIEINDVKISMLDDRYDVARISTSRGCPFDCSFCSTPAIRKLTNVPTYRAVDTEHLHDLILDAQNNGKRKIYINDDLYVANNTKSRRRAVQVASRLIEGGVTIPYKVQIRADSFLRKHEDDLHLLRKSGLREVFLGLESGSKATLEQFNKEIEPDGNLEAVSLYDDVGIKINAGNLVAAPDVEYADIAESIEMFSDCHIAYLFFRRVTFRAAVFPGTQIERQMMNQGRLGDLPRYLDRQYDFRVPKLGQAVLVLEQQMPQFLAKIGAKAFNVRSKCLLMKYDGVLSLPQIEEMESILKLWSDEAALLLSTIFNDLEGFDLERIPDLVGGFTTYTEQVVKDLSRFSLVEVIDEELF